MSDSSGKDAPGALEVASFLRRHPGFLNEFPDLALTLMLPREQGVTTSLASYQLDVLRDKNRELQQRLRELIQTATENEQLMVRVHSLSLALMRERTLGDSVRRVVASLTEDFHDQHGSDGPAHASASAAADSPSLVRLVLFREASSDLPVADWLILAPNGTSQLPAFTEFCKRGEALCGRLQPDKLDVLFGAQADMVHSAVLVPIEGAGMLAIGSQDANRFHPGMGTVFLKLIAEAIGAAIARFPQS